MNRSPETTRTELEAEERLVQAGRRPADPDLAADWDLRETLRGLNQPTLPPALRTRVLRATRNREQPARWLGLAAAIALALALAVVLGPDASRPPAAAVSDAELQELRVALATLEQSARRTSAVAGRELASTLTIPDMRLDALPYATHFRQAIEPDTSSNP